MVFMVPKNIVLKLVSIVYSGKSIGNDFRIEVEVRELIFSTDITLERGGTANLNKEIGIFAADQAIFELPVKIEITEKDPMYDDVAGETIRLKIDLSKERKGISTHRIGVHETRKYSKGKEAIFEITLEMLFQDAIRYLEETKQGFIVVKDAMEKDKSLPAFLNVKFEKREKGRDYFTILEGIDRTKKFSVVMKNEKESYLLAGDFHQGSAFVTYSKSKKILTIRGKAYQTIDDPSEPWKKGRYDIEIPDAPHERGLRYLHKAPKALIWFRIGHDGAKYIHTGQGTLGCITVIEHERWNEIYEILIRARKGDERSVGILEVID